MIWTKGLKGKIVEKGLTGEKIAFQIGIYPSTFSMKLNNKADFTATEIGKISDILGLNGDIEKYFFAKGYDSQS